jgi:uncharacterized membrane protein
VSRAHSRWRRLGPRLAAVAVAAVAIHAAVVWALPRLIMQRVVAASAPERSAGVFLPPMTDHEQRRIVMPSPDLLYAACAFDVGEQPLRVQADPRAPGYWSIALYASNSDNFHVLNDRQAAGRPVDLVVVGPKAYASAPAVPAGATLVTAPTARGLLLMRVLVADYAAERAVVEAARATLRCERLR